MEQRGLVARKDDPADRRGCMIVLTSEGMDRLEAAAPHHVASVRTHFLDPLTEREVATLTKLAERVVTRLGPTTTPDEPQGGNPRGAASASCGLPVSGHGGRNHPDAGFDQLC